MGVSTQIIYTWKCDVCGWETHEEHARGGHADVTVRTALKAHTGDVGYSDAKQWWCASCYHAFSDWARERKINEARQLTREK